MGTVMLLKNTLLKRGKQHPDQSDMEQNTFGTNEEATKFSKEKLGLI